jgi:hypothetical protein
VLRFLYQGAILKLDSRSSMVLPDFASCSMGGNMVGSLASDRVKEGGVSLDKCSSSLGSHREGAFRAKTTVAGIGVCGTVVRRRRVECDVGGLLGGCECL